MLTDYVVIDLEMTGLNAKTDRILETGAARVRGNVVTATFSEIINPKRELSEKVISLTGITNEMAVQGKEMDATLMAFLDFIGEDILVGQNVIFDYSFLKQWAVNHKRTFERNAVDTLKLARKFLPQEQKKDLASLCSYFGIERALDDVMETQQIFEQMQKMYEAGATEAFRPYPLQYKVKKQSPATPQQIKYLKQFVEFHGIPMPEIYEDATRSEISRLIDQLIAQYGKMKKEPAE